MYIQPLPLVQIAAFELNKHLLDQLEGSFLEKDLEKLPCNLKDRIRHGRLKFLEYDYLLWWLVS